MKLDATLAAVALVAVAVVSFFFALHTWKAEGRAREAAARAEADAEKSRKVANLLADLIQSMEPLGLKGHAFHASADWGQGLTDLQLLDRAARMVTKELKDEPAVQPALMTTIGNLYRSRGRYREATPLIKSAYDTRRKALGEDDPDVAASLYYLAWLYHDQGDYETAERLYRQALKICAGRGDKGSLADSIKFNLAWLMTDMEEYVAGEELFRDLLKNRLGQLDEHHREVAIVRLGLAINLLQQNPFSETMILEAMILSGQAWEVFQKQEGGRNIVKLLDLLVKGVRAREAKKPKAAVDSMRQARDITCQSLGDKHPYVTIILNELALTLEMAGDDDEAEKNYRECWAIAKAVFVVSAACCARASTKLP
jgi:tetratricopeptide (TPR) repeat protein